MEKKIAAHLVVQIKKEVTHWRFLLLNRLDKHKVMEAFSQVDFYDHILGQVMDKDYTCKRSIASFRCIGKTLFNLDIGEDFLSQAYNYTLRLSFPDAVETLEETYPSLVFDMYLRYMHIINKHQKKSDDGSFMAIYPFELLNDKEINSLEHPEEYKAFKGAFQSQEIYTMMKLNYEVDGHSTIQHILGVHYLALHIGRQLQARGIDIDLGRVSGAAAGHDLGKFGCKPEDKHKIAYYHYYYTYHWFSCLDIEYIKQVAVYHSTWDLEIESLSVESLVLIFSDFCVKRSRTKPGIFAMKFLNVQESFEVILNKLDALDDIKKKRYEKVYLKLKNFSEYMESLGMSVTIKNYDGSPGFKAYDLVQKEASLVAGPALGQTSVNDLKYRTIESSLEMMYKLRNEWSLTQLLQEASGEKNSQNFRRYLFVFEEYSTYLTPHQKLLTLEFLSKYVMHPEEDIRKTIGHLMGRVLAMYDENYTKELPASAQVVYTIENKLNQFSTMVDDFLKAHVFVTPSKRQKQVMTYLYMVTALYEEVEVAFKGPMTERLLAYLDESLEDYGHDFMIQVISKMPIDLIKDKDIDRVMTYLMTKVSEKSDVGLLALQSLVALSNQVRDLPAFDAYKDQLLDLKEGQGLVTSYFLGLIGAFEHEEFEIRDTTAMFLENLKSDTHKVKKLANVTLLKDHALKGSHEIQFYTAMHYCNLLKVSAYEEVRHTAGDALVTLYDLLSPPHRNDIVVELLRALEMEGFGFTKYIPQYLGQLIPGLPREEYLEILDDVRFKIDNANSNIQVLLLETLKTMIQTLCHQNLAQEGQDLVGIIFKGLYSIHSLTRQVAFEVLCKGLLGNSQLSLDSRYIIFTWTYRKLGHFIQDFNVFYKTHVLEYAVGMHYIYHFITDYVYARGKMVYQDRDKVVLYSGTFDPFSLGQKEVCKDLASMGFDVEIALSEFQWQRRTQPSLLRRRIVEMTIADLFSVSTWPQNQPLNLEEAEDLIQLRDTLAGKEVYIAIGEEALLNDAVYGDANHEIYRFPHVVYKRRSQVEDGQASETIEKRKQYFVSPPQERGLEALYESIDVNRIRRNIDQDWDAFYVLDDLASQYIHKKRLYKNEPQYKGVIESTPFIIKEYRDLEGEARLDLLKDFSSHETFDKTLVGEASNTLFTILHEVTGEIYAYGIYTLKEPGQEISGLTSRETSQHRVFCLLDLDMKLVEYPHSLDQILVTELLISGIHQGCTMALVQSQNFKTELYGVLMRSGFKKVMIGSGNFVFKGDMSAPVILNLDGTARMKETFRRHGHIREAIRWARASLQEHIVKMYPNTVVLSFDRGMMYNHLIRMITSKNSSLNDQGLGPYLCVPYGDVFKRWLLPQTMTKAFHAERYYPPDLDHFDIDASPGYLPLVRQGQVLKSFKKPLILVDDILDRGNRLIAFESILEALDLEVEAVYTGLATQRGKERFSQEGMTIKGAYNIPEVKAWFNEGDVYPFMGGNGIRREHNHRSDVLYSVNLILPFVYPRFMMSVSPKKWYDFSMTCLENAKNIFEALEEVYLETYGKQLTIEGLNEVMVVTKLPDIGEGLAYRMQEKPSVIIRSQIEALDRLKHGFTNNEH